MKLEPKKTVSLSAVTFFAIILIGGIGWIVTLNELQKHQDGLSRELFDIGAEILKVVVIAAAAAIAVDRFLRENTDGDPRRILDEVGIQTILTRRQDAGELLLQAVRNDNVRQIIVCGISLRDFLTSGGSLFEVWREIRERLRSEHRDGLQDSRRLHVRFLLLLPNSDEGYFRHAVESGNKPDSSGMPADVPNAVSRVEAAQEDIFGSIDSPYLQVRLYEHCPFAFIFMTDVNAFVEQYDYRDQGRPAAMPLIEYRGGTSQYRELIHSLDVIWDHAQPPHRLRDIGCAAAIREAHIENIFRSERKSSLTARQLRAIEQADHGSIDIMAITGKFYSSNPAIAREIQRVSAPLDVSTEETQPGIPVRFLIINPVSEQAILRAIADTSPPGAVGTELRNWNWSQHQQSDLYRDARNTAHLLSTWKDQKDCDINVRMYSSSIACMILRTSHCAFVEQYMYGRSKVFQQGFNLGGEYPVLEYDLSLKHRGETVEHEVIAATFDMVWRFFSIPWESYLIRGDEEEFSHNLQRLRTELEISS